MRIDNLVVKGDEVTSSVALVVSSLSLKFHEVTVRVNVQGVQGGRSKILRTRSYSLSYHGIFFTLIRLG